MSTISPPRADDAFVLDTVSPPAPPAGRRSRVERVWRGPDSDPVWVRPTLLLLLGATAALYLWGLGASGWANSYYSAAVQAGTKSWKAFFFGSTDASNFITVDKTPASLWVMEISGRLFGVNSWSVLVPQALEGVAAVAILFAAVKRWFSPAAAFVAGTAFALTPVAALMFRFNNPDALLVLLLVAGAYAMTRALEDGRLRWIVAAGTCVGFGFLAKELQAFLVLPAFGLVYLLAGPPRLARRVADVVLLGVTTLVAGGWWVAVVQLWPASSRPYIGGSQNNSFWNVLFGYNGFGRLTGNESGSVGGAPTGTGQWGPTGLTRMFNSQFGGQVSWLLPAALVLLVAGLAWTARNARTDRTRAALGLWGGWLVVTGLAFSLGQGIIHEYYSVALAPAIGAIVGIGATLFWARRDNPLVRVLLGFVVAVTALWAYVLLQRSPTWLPALRTVVLVGGLAVAAVVAIAPGLRGRAGAALAAGAVVFGLAAPAAYTLSTVAHPHTGAIPTAGPATNGGGPGGRGFGARNGNPRVPRRLRRDEPRRLRAARRVDRPRRSAGGCDRARGRESDPRRCRPCRCRCRCRWSRRRWHRGSAQRFDAERTDHRAVRAEHRLPVDGRRDRRQQRRGLPARVGTADHGDRRIQRHRPDPDARAVPAVRPRRRHPLFHRGRPRRRRWAGVECFERDRAVGRAELHGADRRRHDDLRPRRRRGEMTT